MKVWGWGRIGWDGYWQAKTERLGKHEKDKGKDVDPSLRPKY